MRKKEKFKNWYKYVLWNSCHEARLAWIGYEAIDQKQQHPPQTFLFAIHQQKRNLIFQKANTKSNKHLIRQCKPETLVTDYVILHALAPYNVNTANNPSIKHFVIHAYPTVLVSRSLWLVHVWLTGNSDEIYNSIGLVIPPDSYWRHNKQMSISYGIVYLKNTSGNRCIQMPQNDLTIFFQ